MRFFLSLTLAVSLSLTACTLDQPAALPHAEPQSFSLSAGTGGSDGTEAALLTLMGTVNQRLEAAGTQYRVAVAEWLGDGESGAVGTQVSFSDRGNQQLDNHFVPGDPRRGGHTDIKYIVDVVDNTTDGVTMSQTEAALDRAMATWDGVNCSTVPVTKRTSIPGLDLGVVEFLSGRGGALLVLADITHAGWLPKGALPDLALGATFTFLFIAGPRGPFTDIDANGKLDTAFREIYYNDSFTWQVNNNIDIETIALHEAGHGLSQAHFGAAFLTLANGELHFAPRAVMNAAYSGIQQDLAGTDNGGHCGIWGS